MVRLAASPPFNYENPSPGQPQYSEKTTYLYDDDPFDPMHESPSGQPTAMPASEVLGLGRVSEVQEWVWQNGQAVQTHWTHTTYDPVTGEDSAVISPEGQVNYAYDPVTGRKVRMWTGTDPSNAPDDTAYAYDSQGRLTGVYTLVLDGTRSGTYGGIDPSSHNPTFTGTPLASGYTYDAAGNLKTTSLADGVTTTYAYDTLERLTDESSVNVATNQSVFAEHYDLRADGSRSDVIDTRYNVDGSVFSQSKVAWGYDADDRLTSEALTVLNDGTGGTSNANGHAPAPYTNVFKFDLAGNRTEQDVSGSQTATVSYTYNEDNELKTETRSGSGAYGISYGYDDAGNLTSQVRTGTNPDTDGYTWDLRGRMSSATVNGTTTTYTYDSNGVRTSETTGSTSTYYLNDPQNPTGYAKAAEESSTPGGTPTRSYILGQQVEGQADAAGTVYLLHDGHGSTRSLLNGAGGVVGR